MRERNNGGRNTRGTAPRRGRKRRRKSGCSRIVGMGLGVIVILAVILACIFMFTPIFAIDNVVCEGNIKSNPQVITEASGIRAGDNIFRTSLRDKEKLIKELDYIESCRIERDLPDTVKIIVTEKRPSAYFSLTGAMAVVGTDGNVLDVLSGSDADEIIASKISPEPSQAPEEETDENDASDEEDPESTADGTIWGYDDDGDPIYRINGGHYEFDEDGNRFFVDDTPEDTPEPDETPAEAEASPGRDGMVRTKGGSVIYSAPVVFGVDLKKYEVGKKAESLDSEKLESVLSALRALDSAGLLERTTEFHAEDLSDVKFTVEDRLEVWFGSFEEFEYKAKFTASVIDNELSPHERAIIDFRDSKLYVRSANYKTQIIAEDKEKTAEEDSESADEKDSDKTQDSGKASEESDTVDERGSETSGSAKNSGSSESSTRADENADEEDTLSDEANSESKSKTGTTGQRNSNTGTGRTDSQDTEEDTSGADEDTGLVE